MSNLKQAIKQNYVKCVKDPTYFINQYCIIQHPQRGKIKFKLYPFQEDVLKEYQQHDYNVVLKSRQLGISTLSAAYSLWLMLFHNDKNVLCIATTKDTAKNLVTKVRIMYDNLPAWLKTAIIENNKLSLRFKNGSQIKAIASNESAGRSEALSLLILDEAAFIEKIDTIWTAAQQTLATGGQCLAISTPNGVGNWFHKTCADAEAGANNFNLTTLPWDVHPERDEIWYKKETKNMSKRQIAQELECNFNTSGETVIDPDCMEWMLSGVKEPKYRTGFDRNFWIWEEFDPTCTYLLVADVARGDGADYSTFHVIKLETLEAVAEYQGKPTLDMYSTMLNQAGREFGNAMLVVENNNIGYSVLDKLIELGYPNLYYSIKSSHQFIEQHQAEYSSNAVPGFTTSMKTRPLIVAKLEEFIRNKLITIYSSRLTNEMKTFIWKNGKPQAMKGYHDDLIMALAIACWVRDTAIQNNARELNYKMAYASSIVTSKTSLNTQIKGQEGYKKDNIFDKMTEAKKVYDQFKWIIK